MRVCIVEDEKWTRQNLMRLITNLEQDVVITECSGGSELLEIAALNNFDCFFLDIMLNDVNGITLAKALHKMQPTAKLIFVTACDEYALQAFDLGAVDYLLKPISQERLKQCFAKIELSPQKKANDTIVIESNRATIKIPIHQIYYIESNLKKCIVCTTTQQYEVTNSLNYFESVLGDKFVKAHRSFLVNWDSIESIVPWMEQYCLILKNGAKKIPVSRKQVKVIKEGINR